MKDAILAKRAVQPRVRTQVRSNQIKSNHFILSLYMHYMYTVKPALSSHSREARNVAAEGRWLFNTGQTYKETLIWEKSKWLLNTGGCLIQVAA